MNLTERVNYGKLKLGVFNRKAPRYGAKPFMGPTTGKADSTPSSRANWGKSRQSISSSGVHSEASINKDDSRIVLALSEGRGEARCEVGIAVINVSQPHLILCQISDTQSYDNTLRKINIFNPSQILIPMTFVDTANQSRLIEKVREQFPQVTYTPVRRNTYNKIGGMEFIQEYCVSSLNSVLLILQYRHYALTAASALFRFLQNNLNIFYASGSIRIDYQESEGYAVIDVSTADRLEIVSSTKPLQASKYSTLFGVLNNCYTRIGERALRTILLQPPFVTSIILERQECVTALMRHPEKLQSIQVMLQKLGNVDQLLTLPTIVVDDSQTCSNRQLNYVLYLNGLVHLIITLGDVISSFDQTLFKNISLTLKDPDFLSIRDMVRTLIHENAYAAKSHNGLLQRCFAIKPGINGLLDLVRKIYSERLDDMREYVKTLGEKYDLPLTLGNNISKGYHIVFSLNKHQRITMKKSDIPKEFIQVCRLAGCFTMKTMELINFQTRIDDIIADILKISNVMIFKTLTSFKKYMGLFFRLCEDIAIVDMMQSLAEVALRNNYVKPTFSDFTEVKESQHPMLDMLAHEKPVPNLISSSQNFNVHIITGPNGSGKSIYIRQLMLLQIMAQIGGYVPASSAVFRPADRMFARVYLEDNMECGASSFVLEMKEVTYILSHITNSSLVIIDELARSTSLEEGAALAMAICEYFVKSSAFVYLTSHFTLVTKLGDMYLNVKNWFMDTEASGDTPKTLKLNFKHSIKNGVTNLKRYGIFMVKNIWPTDLLEDVYTLLENNTKTQKEIRTQQPSKESRVKYNLEADLGMLRGTGKLNPSKINKLINHYQADIDNINLSIGDLFREQIQEPVPDNVPHFDDTLPDDVLSEAMDQMEYSLMSQNVDSYNSSYKRLSCFIGENSENIHLLQPEIQINEASVDMDTGTNPPIGFNIHEGTNTFNPNIKILSNILLNGYNSQNNYPHCNNQLTHNPNLLSYSQESFQNSQDSEEINEINRSLLTEMHVAKENFKNMNSATLYEDANGDFIDDSFQNKNNQEPNSTVEIIPVGKNYFKSYIEESNQTSDFCFLKPSEPPIKKRFNFKLQSPMNEKRENFDETDQLTFSLGLIQNREKTSTPIISRNHYSSQSDKKINTSYTNIDASYNYPEGCLFTQENIAPWQCGVSMNKTDQSPNVRNTSHSREYIDSIDEMNREEQVDSQHSLKIPTGREYYKFEQNSLESYSQDNKTNEGVHLFPEINILQGPNNESLSFGEEDKPLKISRATNLNKNAKDKNDLSSKEKIDENFEKFIIEETKMFLSDSADLFDGEVDELEISIENNEHSRKSHEEVSENIISILKSEGIPSGKDRSWYDVNEEILIKYTQPKLNDEDENTPRGDSISAQNNESNNSVQYDTAEKFLVKGNEVLEEHENGEVSQNTKNSRSIDRDCDKNDQVKNFISTHNLFEESDLETYLNNDLTIPKVKQDSELTKMQGVSVRRKLSSPITETTTKHKLIITPTLHNTKKEPSPVKTKFKKDIETIRENTEYSGFTSPSNNNRNEESASNKKNNEITICTSLSDASKKRNLDNSSLASTSSKDKDNIKISNKKKNHEISQQNNIRDKSNSSSKSPKSTIEMKTLSSPSKFGNINDSITSNSRDRKTSSISEASRKRNLDNPSSTSTNSRDVSTEVSKKLSTPSKIPTEENNDSISSNSGDKETTSISEASRKRNLDNPSTSTNSQDDSIEVEKKTLDSSYVFEEMNDSITPRTDKINSQPPTTEPFSNYSGNHSISYDDYKECKENIAVINTDSSNVCYETAVETDCCCEKSEIDKLQLGNPKRKRKRVIKDIGSKRHLDISKCSTITLTNPASMHLESGSNSPSTSGNRKLHFSSRILDNKTKIPDNEIMSIEVAEKVENNNELGNVSMASNEEDSLNEDVSGKQPKKKKYLGYRRRPNEQSIIVLKKSKNEGLNKIKSFKPLKLTKNQIQEEFDKQDQRVFEENLDIESYNKYLQQRMNRPSVKQIQNAEHIATFRRTENGTIILPKTKSTYRKKKSMSTKSLEMNKIIDVSIFSDQNANKMSAFLASDERNYNQFKFTQGMVASNEDSHNVTFYSQFVQKKERIKFNRSRSFGEFKFRNCSGVRDKSFKFEADVAFKFQESQSSSIFLPDGYLKENKKDIDFICSKYLNDSNCGFYRARTSPLS